MILSPILFSHCSLVCFEIIATKQFFKTISTCSASKNGLDTVQ